MKVKRNPREAGFCKHLINLRKRGASARVFSIIQNIVETYPRAFRPLGLWRPNQTVRTLQHEGLIFQDSARLVSSWRYWREKGCKFFMSTKIAPGLSDTPYYQPMLLGEGPGRLAKTEGKPLASPGFGEEKEHISGLFVPSVDTPNFDSRPWL